MESFLEALIPSSFTLVILLCLIGIVFLFFSALKTKEQKKHFERLHEELAPGCSIMFCGGIFGEIINVKTDEVDVRIAPKTVITISRYAIQAIVKKEK